MNFIDAALTVLKESRKALSTEELAERVSKQKLLAKPGKDPLRSIQSALGRELGKGDESRVEQVGDDRWRMSKGSGTAAVKTSKAAAGKAPASQTNKTNKTGKPAPKAKATTAKPAAGAAAKKTTAAKTATTAPKTATTAPKAATTAPKTATTAPKTAGKAAAPSSPPKAATKASKPTAAKAAAAPVKAKPAAVEAAPEATTPAGKADSRRGAKRAVRADETIKAASEAAIDTTLDIQQTGSAPPMIPAIEGLDTTEALVSKDMPRRGGPEQASPEDRELAELYGDELTGTAPGAAFEEYRDAQTEDEDRPMMPEMVGSRRERQRMERLERRKRRRETRQSRTPAHDQRRDARPERPEREARPERDDRAGQQGARPGREQLRPRPELVAHERTPEHPDKAEPAQLDLGTELPFYRPGNPLADAAARIMNGFKNGQPVQIKQLAQMMRKRQLIAGNPAELWPHIKMALISDEQAHLSAGLKPRIVYRGRDLFEPTSPDSSTELAAAQAAFVQAVEQLYLATHITLKERLSNLGNQAFERLVYAYLMRQGWKSIQWFKRVERASYALADAPDGRGTVLVGLCTGKEQVDRRGIGMLRVGVKAKALSSGLLIAAQELADSGRHELAENGPSLALLTGDTFIASLVASGIGVIATHTRSCFLDERFFAELDLD